MKFTEKGYEQFQWQLGIKHLVSFVEHPQTNGQTEVANKVILTMMNKKGCKTKGLWTELPSILWAYHWTPQSTTKETPFKLTYGTYAMIPVEVDEPSTTRAQFEETLNNENLPLEHDMIDEVRNHAQIQEEACKRRAT